MLPSGPRPALVLVAAGCALTRAQRVELFERAGHRVLEAIDGVHALALATRHCRITVTDLVLPSWTASSCRCDGVESRPERYPVGARPRSEPTLDTWNSSPDRRVRSGSARAGSARRRGANLARREPPDPAPRTCRHRAPRRTAAIRRHAPRLRAQIANGTDEAMISVLVADDNAHYIEANSAICALAGYRREQLLQMSIWDLSRRRRRRARPARVEAVSARRPVRRPLRIRRSTGDYITLRCSAAANVVPGLHVSTMAPAKLLQVLRT